MILTSAFSRLDVVIHTEPAEWWQVLAAVAPLAVLIGLMIAVVTIRYQRRRWQQTGARVPGEWWDRAEWALEMALDEKPERYKAGLATLEQLGDGPLGKVDAQILAQAKMVLKRP